MRDRRTMKIIVKSMAVFLLVVFVGNFASVNFSLARATGAAVAAGGGSFIAGIKASLKTSSALGPGGMTPDLDKAADAMEIVDEELITEPARLIIGGILLDLVSFFMNRIAYDAATWMANVGSGEPAFQEDNFDDYLKDLGLDMAGEAFASLTDILDEAFEMEFNICDPGSAFFRAGIQLGIGQKYQRPKPRCEFDNFTKNWSQAFSSFKKMGENPSEYALGQIKKMLKPGQSVLDASIGINVRVQEKVLEAKMSQFTKEIVADKGFKDVKDFITGNVKTPSSLVQATIDEQLVTAPQGKTKDEWKQVKMDDGMLLSMVTSAGSMFTNTLLSKVLDRIYKGLISPNDDDIDHFDVDLPSVSGYDSYEAAAKANQDLLTVEFSFNADYNPIGELLACPGSSSRGLYNCAMDSDLALALSRSESGETITIETAMEDGQLNGSWQLIPADDYSTNQDVNCYSYAFCYANLVKLRKFRIIPVGWEMAANSPYNSSSDPVTLQEVVDGFDDCGLDGELNANHPWCHLIDPNWVLVVPDTQCNALTSGETLMSSSTFIRNTECSDVVSCVSEDDDGDCDGGYAYCTREENIWRFHGDDCPEEYATCLSFDNIDTNENDDWLLNTVDFDSCTADNAGCMWYRTRMFFDDFGTLDDTDDAFAWLATGDDFVTADRDDDIQFAGSTIGSYEYDTGNDVFNYNLYAYQDRRYFNNDVEECAEEYAGCTELIIKDEETLLNVIANASFEDDVDDDDLPDVWQGISADDYYQVDEGATYGVDHVLSNTTSYEIYQENIVLSPSRFYTFSFYASDTDLGAGSALVNLELVDADPDPQSFDLGATTILGDCALSGTQTLQTDVTSPGADPVRYECTLTTPSVTTYATIKIINAGGELSFDAFMLEEGSILHDFQQGYGNVDDLEYDYLNIPPAYLGCTGLDSDPTECENYARVCSAQDVGCELYTPTDGDPSVPAVVNTLDLCPAACVGYDTYKQETSRYDEEEFPLYFIPSTAGTCESSDIGCDEFTNLDDLEAGGEGLEYYTYLRICSEPDLLETDDYATYFTWEGSDLTGYQLVSWNLLESNLGDNNDHDFNDQDGVLVFEEQNIGQAPCVNPILDDTTSLVCEDHNYQDEETLVTGIDGIDDNQECNEHDDIFDNPDCREFFDSLGNIHYREFSYTATITEDCHPYRKSESTEIDCGASGGYWTEVGECRYLGYPDESTICYSSANGCRSYTGGAGRNATTIFYDDVEDDDIEEWFGDAVATVSNESVAVDGHSIHVTSGDLKLLYLSEVAANDCEDDVTCELEDLVYGTGASCEVYATEEIDDCGGLVGALVQGKTYILSFWAKGASGVTIGSGLIEEGGGGTIHRFQVNPVDITTGWQLYEMGPLDTSDAIDFELFDDTAILNIHGSGEYYIDNIYLKEVEDNITLIKDSWVTPSTCDQTLQGVQSEQYYLGCEAYTNSIGEGFNIYRFSNLCTEDAIGCSAYFDTNNSESIFSEAYNVTCSLGAVVDVATACYMDSESVCTVGVAKDSCQFDWEGALPSPLPTDISYGPEAVIVTNDTDIYLIDDGNSSCTETYIGCQEFGQPTFNQDKSEVTEFTSTYIIDLPDEYTDTLCNHESLFCAAWSTNEDGNYYFKDPLEQACEWKESVQINGQTYYGWFRTGTSQACYSSNSCTSNIDLVCYEDADCQLAAGICEMPDGVCTLNADVCSSDPDCITDYGPCYDDDGDNIGLCEEDNSFACLIEDKGTCETDICQGDASRSCNNNNDCQVEGGACNPYPYSLCESDWLAGNEVLCDEDSDCAQNDCLFVDHTCSYQSNYPCDTDQDCIDYEGDALATCDELYYPWHVKGVCIDDFTVACSTDVFCSGNGYGDRCLYFDNFCEGDPHTLCIDVGYDCSVLDADYGPCMDTACSDDTNIECSIDNDCQSSNGCEVDYGPCDLPANGSCDNDPSIECTDDTACGEQDYGTCDAGIDEAYLIAGAESGIWRNGDANYTGWAGQCEAQYDRCTEFLDPADTSEGDFPEGTPYYYLNNAAISEEYLSPLNQCSGQTSQNKGCVLFNNTNNAELNWNSVASYIASAHADDLFGDAQFSKQAPIDCDSDYGGLIRTPAGEQVDLCWSRCQYPVHTARVGLFPRISSYTYGIACYTDNDCPLHSDVWGNEVEGTCLVKEVGPVDEGYEKLTNDSNEVLKVDRDRECSEWMSCSSSSYGWSESAGGWRETCNDIRACNDFSPTGTHSCTGFPELDPVPLDMVDYSSRDVSWYGNEYSGYSIPDSLPISYLDQINLVPSRYCVDGHGNPADNADTGLYQDCIDDGDCTNTCEDAEVMDYRLAYIASSCEEGNNTSCVVGYCSDTGELCASDGDCSDTSSCVVGYCKRARIDDDCTTDAYCADHYGNMPYCENGICVSARSLADAEGATCSTLSDCLDGDGDPYHPFGINDGVYTFANTCQLITGAIAGTCVNGQCIVGQDGQPFTANDSEEIECRGYPEGDSPFPVEVVEEWKVFVDADGDAIDYQIFEEIDADDKNDAKPYNLRYGFENVNVCAPNGGDCMCSYNKATYQNGVYKRYYNTEYSMDEGQVMSGICMGGQLDGMVCSDDGVCGSGTCAILDNFNTYLGWNGYCLERDTAINRWADPNGEGICLTWLPVDQLTGATDLDAKDLEAGYPMENQYHCVETGYYRDFFTIGVEMGEDGALQQLSGNQVACASTQYGEYRRDDDWWDLVEFGLNVPENALNGCWQYVYCPEGYKGIVAFPVDLDNGYRDGYDDWCMDDSDGGTNDFFGDDVTNSWHDCPYVCIPSDSYTPEGESCEQEWVSASYLGRDFDRSGTVEEDEEESYYGTPVKWAVKLGEGGGVLSSFDWHECMRRGVPVAQDVDEYEMDWHTAFWVVGGGNDPPGSELGGKYIPGVDVTLEICYANAGVFADDCELLNEAVDPGWVQEGMGLDRTCSYDPDELLCDDIREEGLMWGRGTSTNYTGFWGLDYTNINRNIGDNTGAFYEYLGCFAIAQVATDNMVDSNKAYTQRLLFDADQDYYTQDIGTGVYENVKISKDDAALYGPAGAMPFEEYFEPVTTGHAGTLYRFDEDVFEDAYTDDDWVDSGPMPVLSCDAASHAVGGLGLYTAYLFDGVICDSHEFGFYPTATQWPGMQSENSFGLAYELLKLTDEIEVVQDVSVSSSYFDNIGSAENYQSSYELLGQFFNKVYNIFLWNWDVESQQVTSGAYFNPTECDDDDNCNFDFPGNNQGFEDGFPNGTPLDFAGERIEEQHDNYALAQALESEYSGAAQAPTTFSIGMCFDTLCREDEDDLFNLNEREHADVEAGGGSTQVTMKFFMTAAPNQFPIRQLIVDWGDGDQTGSMTEDNFYKAHRGLTDESQTESLCDTEDQWGMTAESCDPSYMTFVHDYVCPESYIEVGVEGYDECEYEVMNDGKEIATNAPCIDGNDCVFQPKVFIKDNWGYCTGVCEGEPGGDLCYDGSGAGEIDECDLDCPDDSEYCPKGNDADDIFTEANPWIYYDGQVRVSPY